MKRKIISVFLALLIIAPLIITASADSSGLCVTAINDNLLDMTSMATYVSGEVYLPSKVFSAFGVYSNYFESASTEMLFYGSNQVFFDLDSGSSYDSNGFTYSISAVLKNGQVYVPAVWVCKYFGLSYSYISGIGYGDIFRIKSGKEILSDSQFLDAATSIMRIRYEEYFGRVDPASPAPSSSLPSGPETSEANISLSFIGIPSDTMLDSLDNYSIKVCFFVTAEEASASADIIRRICGSGHSIGIYCEASPESECEEASDVIFEVAQIRPVLITSPTLISQSCSEYAKSNGYAYFEPDTRISESVKYYSAITSEFDDKIGYTSIYIPIAENTESFLPYVLQNIAVKKISVLPLRETLI